MSEKYKQGQRIYFRLGNDKPEGWATIEGVVGFVIIIKPEIPIKYYDFTHTYITENQIVKPPEEKEVKPEVQGELKI